MFTSQIQHLAILLFFFLCKQTFFVGLKFKTEVGLSNIKMTDPVKINVSEIQDRLRRSIPVPMKMLKLLDQEDGSDDDENYVTESFETVADEPSVFKSDEEIIEDSETPSQEKQQMVSEKENISTEPKITNGEVPTSVALQNQVPALSASLESMKVSQQIGITPVKQSTQNNMPVAFNSNVFKTPECRPLSLTTGSKSVQSLLPKQNTMLESHR